MKYAATAVFLANNNGYEAVRQISEEGKVIKAVCEYR